MDSYNIVKQMITLNNFLFADSINHFIENYFGLAKSESNY